MGGGTRKLHYLHAGESLAQVVGFIRRLNIDGWEKLLSQGQGGRGGREGGWEGEGDQGVKRRYEERTDARAEGERSASAFTH
jgi:hypothetical protein